jgi:hypothetical protein
MNHMEKSPSQPHGATMTPHLFAICLDFALQLPGAHGGLDRVQVCAEGLHCLPSPLQLPVINVWVLHSPALDT